LPLSLTAQHCASPERGFAVKEDNSAELWQLVAVALIAALFFIGMLTPGGVGPA
jgi:hypothetical protein